MLTYITTWYILIVAGLALANFVIKQKTKYLKRTNSWTQPILIVITIVFIIIVLKYKFWR